MDAPSARLMKLSSRRSARPPEMPRMGSDHHGSSYSDKSEGKKKGRPRVEGQELRDIPAQMMVRWKDEFKSRSRVKCPSPGCWLEFPSVYGLKYHYQRCQGSMAAAAEKLRHACPHCEAVFATKVRLQKHKLWNHPERAPPRPESEATHQRSFVKGSAKKRPTENSPPPPLKVRRRSHKVTRPAHNGACAQRPATPSDSGGSESDEDSLPPPFPEEDPERMKHRRKQKTPKKFTGEQPSISGTFGLKGMNKVEEKLKAGRMKRAESLLADESQRKSSLSTAARKEPATICSAPPADGQWHASERAQVVCPTCSVVTRKTVSGLKKHMEICKKLRDALRCQQCHKQFRSKAGLNYHTTTDHLKASAGEHVFGEEQVERERLGRALKQAGTISCPNQGCSADSQFHQRRCGGGGEPRDSDKPVFLCQHCGKTYRSKTGRDYHLRAEHPLASLEYWNREEIRAAEEVEEEREEHLLKESEEELVEKNEDKDKADQLLDLDRTPSGRVRRRSAQVAVFHLQEIAEDELAKDWGNKRRIKDDLVPDIKRLNYTRPGLPNFSSETMDGWKSQVKEKGFICCPNCNCEAIYSSVSGLKAHLANCNKGGGDVGKYTCLLCHKEFNSESGVKYHISKTHSQNWFRTSVNDASNNKKKDPEPDSNGLQDVKHEAPGKKRGRKPKDPPTETLSVLTDTPTFSSTPPLTHTPSADTQELHPICHASPTRPALENSGSPTHTRDRKRVKSRRAFSDE